MVLGTAPAALAGTTIVSEEFGPGWTPGTEWAVSGTYTPHISTPGGQSPAAALRLTDASILKTGAITYTTPQPMTGGLDVRFAISQWGGGPPYNLFGNGISFFLRKGSAPTNAATAWTEGAGLGYVGLPAGLVGIGFGRFGGFVWGGSDGSNCVTRGTDPLGPQPYIPNNISVRGPGESTGWVGLGPRLGNGYCLLPGVSPDLPWVVTNSPTGTPTIDFSGGSRAAAARAIRVTVDPSTVANPKIKVFFQVRLRGVDGRCDQ